MKSRNTISRYITVPVLIACMCLCCALPGFAGGKDKKNKGKTFFKLENTGTLLPRQRAGDQYIPLERMDAYFHGEDTAAAVAYGSAKPSGPAKAQPVAGGQSGVVGSDGKRHEIFWHVDVQEKLTSRGGDPAILLMESQSYDKDVLEPDSIHYVTVNREQVVEYKHSKLHMFGLKKRRGLNPTVRLAEKAIARIADVAARKKAENISSRLTPYDLSSLVGKDAVATQLKVLFPEDDDDADEMRALVFFNDGSIVPLLGYETKGGLNVPDAPAGPAGLVMTDVVVDWGDDADEFRFIAACENPKKNGATVYSYDFKKNKWKALFRHKDHRKPARLAVNWKTEEIVIAFNETGSVFYRKGLDGEGGWEELMEGRAFPIHYHGMEVNWNKKAKPQVVVGAEIPGTRYIRFTYFNGKNMYPYDWKSTPCTSLARHARIEVRDWPKVHAKDDYPSMGYFISWPQHDYSFMGYWDRKERSLSVLWDGETEGQNTANAATFRWDDDDGRLKEVVLGFNEGDVKTYDVKKFHK